MTRPDQVHQQYLPAPSILFSSEKLASMQVLVSVNYIRSGETRLEIIAASIISFKEQNDQQKH